MIVAIDGPAGSGKSTVAKLVAKELGFNYIDTGAMYRAVTLAYLNLIDTSDSNKKNFSNHSQKFQETPHTINFEELISLLPELCIKFHNDKILLNDEDVSGKIRSSEISNNVSAVSAIKEVRDKLVEEQRNMGKAGNVVLDGRDIGTVVFPNANLKIFLTASAEIRAKRRMKDLEKLGEHKDLNTLVEEIKLRDKKDSERKESPLKKANDAIEINTDDLTIEEVVKKIIGLV